MYEAMGYDNPEALAAMASITAEYLSNAMGNGSFRGWLAVHGSRVVGGGAVVIAAWPSHPYDLECRRATVLNVYVDPDCRRQGIARRLMQTMIEWCRKQGFARVYLHASESGRPLYESMGFEPTTEMQFTLR